MKVDIKDSFKTQDAIVCTSRNHNGNNNYYYISNNDDDDERNNKKGYKKEICLTWMLIIKEKLTKYETVKILFINTWTL